MRAHKDDDVLKMFGIDPSMLKNVAKTFGIPYDIDNGGFPVDGNNIRIASSDTEDELEDV